MSLKSSSSRNRERGFTLVEILAVLAIVGLATLVSIPFFRTFVRRSRIEGTAREIHSMMLAARLQALKRGNNVGVVFSNDSSSRAYKKATMFIDADRGGTLNTGDTVLSTFDVPPEKVGAYVRVAAPDVADPPSDTNTYDAIFTPFGSAIAASSTQSIYVKDDHDNIVQVRIPNAASGKVTMTKKVTGTTYVAPPWKWK